MPLFPNTSKDKPTSSTSATRTGPGASTQEIPQTTADAVLFNLSKEFGKLLRGVQTYITQAGKTVEIVPGSRVKLAALLASSLVQSMPKTRKPATATAHYWVQFCTKRDAAAKFLTPVVVPKTTTLAWEAPFKAQIETAKKQGPSLTNAIYFLAKAVTDVRNALPDAELVPAAVRSGISALQREMRSVRQRPFAAATSPANSEWRSLWAEAISLVEEHGPDPIVDPQQTVRDAPVASGAPGTPWWKIGLGVAVVGVVGYVGYHLMTSKKE